MKRSAIFISTIIFLIAIGSGISVFSQDTDDNGTEGDLVQSSIVSIGTEGATFSQFDEYVNASDKYGGDTFEITSQETHYKANKINRTGQGEGGAVSVITLSYYRGASQTQGISKIAYRDNQGFELPYVNNSRYERPFTVLRYELDSTEADAKILKKELVDREGEVIEYYDYLYNDNGLVSEFSKYAISPFMNEFQLYEISKFYYTQGATDPNNFLYYDVIGDGDNVKFTYSSAIPPFFTTGGLSGVTEVFVQYKSNVDEKNSAIKRVSQDSDEVIMQFDSRYIQYVIAPSDTHTFVFNGDGSLRQAIAKTTGEGTNGTTTED